MSRQPTSRSCFVCGRENPVGLKVRWDQDPEAGEIRGTVTVPGHFNGYPGVTHGGIVAALLDETAGRTILMDGGFEDLMVTAKLEVVYRRPTPTGVPLLVVGRLLRPIRHAGGSGGRASPPGRHGRRRGPRSCWRGRRPRSSTAGRTSGSTGGSTRTDRATAEKELVILRDSDWTGPEGSSGTADSLSRDSVFVSPGPSPGETKLP